MSVAVKRGGHKRSPEEGFTAPIDAFPGATRADRGPRPSKSDQLAALRTENAQLRELLNLDRPMDEEVWGEYAPQELRDNFAASALIASELHPIDALVRLGFSIPPREPGQRLDPYYRELAARIFETPGVKAILAEDAQKFSANKESVMRRMAQIAKHGSDGDATRAASVLSKMIEGWSDGDKGKNPQQVLNFLMQVVGGHHGSALAGGANGELQSAADNVVDADAFFAEDAQEVALVLDEPEAFAR